MSEAMNDTDPGGALPPPYAPPGASPTEPRPPLRRSRDDRIVGGVSGGLARTFGVDPVVFRVVFAALTVIGGSGVLLYGLLWFLVPEDGSDGSSVGDRWILSRRWSTTTVVLLALAAAVGLSLLVGLDPGALVLLAVIAAVAVFVVRREQRPPRQPYLAQGYPAQAYPTQVYPTQVYGAYSGQPDSGQPESGQQPPYPPYPGVGGPPPRPPKPPRERSALGILTLGVTALTVGLLVAVRMVNDNGTPSSVTVLASGTLVIGLGLLVGTFLGRARWLVIPGVLLLLLTAAAGVVDRIDGLDGLDGPKGSRTFTPQTALEVQSTYDWGVGELVLDLTEVAGNPDLAVSVDLGIGSLRVVVPDGATIAGTADVGLGSVVTVDGSEYDGFDAQADLADSPATRDRPASDQTITLDLEVGLGEVVVSRA